MTLNCGLSAELLSARFVEAISISMPMRMYSSSSRLNIGFPLAVLDCTKGFWMFRKVMSSEELFSTADYWFVWLKDYELRGGGGAQPPSGEPVGEAPLHCKASSNSLYACLCASCVSSFVCS